MPLYLDEGIGDDEERVLWPLGEELRYSGSPNEFVRRLPHYHLIPKETRAQIRWRNELLAACEKSPSSQARLKRMCREDVLFFFNSMLVVYEPRNPRHTTLPFNTWPHQDDVIAAISHYLGLRDIGVNKSRGEGCSWLVLMIFLHRWLFDTRNAVGSYGLVSLNEDLVDDAKNPDSLMWKLDWELTMLPSWLLPKGFNFREHRSKSDHTLVNPETGATIKGFACTQNVASGGRKTSFLMDELGKWPRPQDSIAMTSTQHVTYCRVIVSTPFGNEGAYYESIHIPSSMLKMTMHWTDNPIRRRGLYRWDPQKEKVLKLDLDYNYPADYPFEKDGKLRSPWYDAECRRPKATPRSIAQDLDLNFEQSVSLFFEPLTMNMANETVKAPLVEGGLRFDGLGQEALFIPQKQGEMRLWLPLTNGRLPEMRYLMGIDISEGTGSDFSSNSCIQVVSLDTGEQIAEWASNTTRVEDFACLSVSMARWLQGSGGFQPFMVWEASGPGGRFGRQVDELGYKHVYLRQPQDLQRGLKKNRWKTAGPGYVGKKSDALTPLQVAIKMRHVTVRSRELQRELGEYRYVAGGKVEHFRAVTSEDESSRGQLHGDRAMAMAMAVVGMNEFRVTRKSRSVPSRPPVLRPNTAGYRLRERLRLVAAEDSEWESDVA